MIKVSCFDPNISLFDLAKSNNINDVCVAKINGGLVELNRTTTSKDVNFLTFDDEEGRRVYCHTAAHILAQAVKRLYPSAKLGFGPPTESGFFYDIDFDGIDFSKDDIEKEMSKIIKENYQVIKKVVSVDEAKNIMNSRGESYKIDLINDLEENDDKVTLREQGEFVDICKGEHLPFTGCVGVIHISSITGAYWKGKQDNKMLTRIYGLAFPSEEKYKEYVIKLEENKKRDHNKIGRSLGYFTTVDYIGQGLPILLPNGARVVQIMQRFVEDEEEKRGYLLTKTPFLAKSDLYKISTHWYHYKENMFILGDENKDDEVFALRPMTCPFQFQHFLVKEMSYRDLPIRWNETSTLFRNEKSGEMHGLIRLRQFTISEGHIACRPDQLLKEFKDCLELAQFMMKTFKIDGDVYYRLSKWDKNNKDKYIGTEEEWENVQDKMREILDSCKVDYVEADGEAAFYGPKLDIQFKNVYGKEDTLITIQIDFQLAKRFEMFYTDSDGIKKNPYIIHRTSLGCYERTLALLLEKYAGALPLWLSPEQVRILPMNEHMVDFAHKMKDKFYECGIKRVSVDNSNEKIGYKIRVAQEEKIPYMVILGQKEVENNKISVRHRSKGDLGNMSFDEFTSMILDEISKKI